MTELAERQRTRLQVEVQKVDARATASVVDVLARAFDDDPVANWFVAQDAKRQQRMHRLWNMTVNRMALRHDEVYSTPEAHGAAVWYPPGRWKMGILQQLTLLPEMVRIATVRRIPTVVASLGAVEKKHPETPHFYLEALAVDPGLQGRSIGTQLMEPVLAHCDAEGIPAYLESSKEINVPLYERNGFRVTEEFTIPKGGPTVWLMWRDPQ